jgi:hypothetical protein
MARSAPLYPSLPPSPAYVGDADHAPAAVADLVDPITTTVGCAGFDDQGGVVVAADDDVAGAARRA